MKRRKAAANVGILTFHRAINYGAVLQAYALSKAVEALGGQPEIIDYRCPAVEERHGLRLTRTLLPDAARRLLFASFRRKFLSQSRERYTQNTIARAADRYSVLISGSDQVFNPALTGGDMAYLLDFAKEDTRKAAYAASFGDTACPSPAHLALLGGFHALTLREPAEGLDAPLALDPVLMLPKEAWYALYPSIKNPKRPYLLLYMIHGDEAVLRFAREIAKQRGLTVLYIHRALLPRPGAKSKRLLRPERFPALFAGASAVVTGSYHGFCFSLIFEKDVYLVEKPGGSARLRHLAETLGLSGRRVAGGQCECANRAIDYRAVNETLRTQREVSLSLLADMIRGL